jgi:hypothetical protein
MPWMPSMGHRARGHASGRKEYCRGSSGCRGADCLRASRAPHASTLSRSASHRSAAHRARRRRWSGGSRSEASGSRPRDSRRANDGSASTGSSTRRSIGCALWTSRNIRRHGCLGRHRRETRTCGRGDERPRGSSTTRPRASGSTDLSAEDAALKRRSRRLLRQALDLAVVGSPIDRDGVLREEAALSGCDDLRRGAARLRAA